MAMTNQPRSIPPFSSWSRAAAAAALVLAVAVGCGSDAGGDAAEVADDVAPPVATGDATVAGDTTVTVTGPTVIAFYHNDRPGMAAPSYVLDAGRAGTLSEFEFNLPRQQSSLAAMGWQLVILYRADFQAATADGTVLGRPDSGPAGYMVVTPGGDVRIRYGVLGTEELEQFVRETR